MIEADLMREIQLTTTRLGHRLWRNNNGVGWVGKLIRREISGTVVLAGARPLHAGLMPGSSDLIGLTAGGRFLSVEVKSDRGRLSDEQRTWLAMVRQFGGLAGVARSADDIEAILRGEISL